MNIGKHLAEHESLGVKPGFTVLRRITLTEEANSIDFPNLNVSDYSWLRILARLTNNSLVNQPVLIFNDDTTSGNYASHTLDITTTLATPGGSNNTSNIPLTSAQASGENCLLTIDIWGSGVVVSGTGGRVVRAYSNTDGNDQHMYGGFWRSESALTKISIVRTLTGAFAAGSRAVLLGMK